MLIKELWIQLYGPLRGRGCSFAPGFNLLWGRNEAGKTLTIDALVKLLWGKRAREKEFSALQRVEEFPEGYLIAEKDSVAYKLPEQGDLAGLTGLTVSECANIFFIRNSDLSIARESEFYTGVTDRLTGLRTDEIEKIKNILRDMGRLTPSGAFRNTGEEKLRSRLERARELAEKIDALLAELRQAGYDSLEEAQVAAEESLRAAAAAVEEMEQARKRELYEKGLAALGKLQGSLRQLKQLQQFDQAGERRWSEAARDAEQLRREKERLEAALAEKRGELSSAKGMLQEKQEKFERLERRKKAIDEEIRPALKNYRAGREALVRQEEKEKLFRGAAIASVILLALSLAGVLLTPHFLFYAAVVPAAAVAAYAWLALYRLAGKRGELAAALEQLRADLARCGLDGGEPGQIDRDVQAFVEDYSAAQGQLLRLQKELAALEREVASLQERRGALEQGLAEKEREMEAIKRRSGAESLPEYLRQLKLKQEVERLAGEQRSVLAGLFGEPGPDLAQNLVFWEEAVNDLAAYRDCAREVRFGEKELTALKAEQQQWQRRLEELQNNILAFSYRLEEIEREVNRVLQEESEYIYCHTVTDLEAAQKALAGFVERHETNRTDALAVIALFEEIEQQEKARVAELFGANSSVSGHFRRFSAGLYETVVYDQAAGAIRVRRRDGALLAAEKLSGGAYDQLYLSIRLALGEKLLQNEKGFFIMDDPLIKSDSSRLQRQLQALLQIAASGWQILYFSAKDEVRDALAQDIAAGHVHLVPLEELPF